MRWFSRVGSRDPPLESAPNPGRRRLLGVAAAGRGKARGVRRGGRQAYEQRFDPGPNTQVALAFSVADST